MRKYTARSLRAARGRDGPGHRLPAGRLHRGRRRRGSPRGVPPRLRLQPLLRHRRAGDLPQRGEGALPAREGRRPARRLLREGGRPGRSRSTSPWRWPRARACRAPPSSRAWPRSGVMTRQGAVTGVDTAYGTIDVRVRRQLRRHVGAAARREDRRQHSAAVRRALLPDHREDPRHRPQLAGARGPGLLRLLPRGGRRPDGRPVRAGVRAVEDRRHARGLLVRRDSARLGPHAPVPREGDGARARLAGAPASRSSSAAPRASRPTCAPSSARRRR